MGQKTNLCNLSLSRRLYFLKKKHRRRTSVDRRSQQQEGSQSAKLRRSVEVSLGGFFVAFLVFEEYIAFTILDVSPLV